MVIKVTFVGFKGAIVPIDPPPWIRPWIQQSLCIVYRLLQILPEITIL